MNKGMTLIEVLIAISIIGIVSIGIGYMTVVTKTNTVGQKVSTESVELITSLADWIYTQAACRSSLMGKSLTAAPVDLELNGYQGFGIFSGTTIKTGLEINNNFKIETLKMMEKNVGLVSPASDYQYNAVNLIKKIAQIDISIQANIPGSTSRSLKMRTLEVPVLVTSANVIQYCLSELSQEQACALNGGSVDSTGKCATTSNCLISGSYQVAIESPSGYGSSGAYSDVPNQITGATSCPPGSTDQISGESPHTSWVYTCGKKCPSVTIYEWIEYHVCIRCG